MHAPATAEAPRHQILNPSEGTASAISHHGEILQGVFAAANGKIHRGLVTLPRHGLSARACFVPHYRSALNVHPAWKTKALKAARHTLEEVGAPDWGGTLRLTDHIPPGYGLGSSTSDVVAAIRAVADAFGILLRPTTISRIAVGAEQASDPIMFEERAVLFGQRDGHILEELGSAIPEVEILGFNTQPDGRGISTLDFPLPNYNQEEIEMFRLMLGLLRAAVRCGRVDYLGNVASASARVNQRYLPKSQFYELERISQRVGAAGLQVAHSGTVAGMMFHPRHPHCEAQVSEAERLLGTLGIRESWRFRAGATGFLP